MIHAGQPAAGDAAADAGDSVKVAAGGTPRKAVPPEAVKAGGGLLLTPEQEEQRKHQQQLMYAASGARNYGFGAEFMMHTYKVEVCKLQDKHPRGSCPYVHPGDVAQRRPPHTYQALLCPEVRAKKVCPRMDDCECSHSAFEFWLHPDRYRTSLCEKGERCTRPLCFFAHNADELRPLPGGLQPAQPPQQAEASRRIQASTSGDGHMLAGVHPSYPAAAMPGYAAAEGSSGHVTQMAPTLLLPPGVGPGGPPGMVAAGGGVAGPGAPTYGSVMGGYLEAQMLPPGLESMQQQQPAYAASSIAAASTTPQSPAMLPRGMPLSADGSCFTPYGQARGRSLQPAPAFSSSGFYASPTAPRAMQLPQEVLLRQFQQLGVASMAPGVGMPAQRQQLYEAADGGLRAMPMQQQQVQPGHNMYAPDGCVWVQGPAAQQYMQQQPYPLHAVADVGTALLASPTAPGLLHQQQQLAQGAFAYMPAGSPEQHVMTRPPSSYIGQQAFDGSAGW